MYNNYLFEKGKVFYHKLPASNTIKQQKRIRDQLLRKCLLLESRYRHYQNIPDLECKDLILSDIYSELQESEVKLELLDRSILQNYIVLVNGLKPRKFYSKRSQNLIKWLIDHKLSRYIINPPKKLIMKECYKSNPLKIKPVTAERYQ